MSEPLLGPLALEVSHSGGFVRALDYVNTIRSVFKRPPMTQQEYDLAVERCMAAGRDVVRAAHRESLDRLMYGRLKPGEMTVVEPHRP